MRTARFFILTLSLLFTGCPEESIQPNENPMTLRVESVVSTEIFLKLSMPLDETNRTVILKRDDQEIATILLKGADTIYVDTDLVPNTSYTYTVLNDEHKSSIQATTMSVTSQFWEYQILDFGEAGSVLFDCVVINDSLLYAVGAIYRNDSVYNAVRWDGKSTTLLQIPFVGPCSAVKIPVITAIDAISPNEIIVSNGGSIVWYDGETAEMDCRMNATLNGAISKVKMFSKIDVYIMGAQGTMNHFDGTKWYTINLGTDLYIKGIEKANDGYIVAASHRDLSLGTVFTYHSGIWSASIQGKSSIDGYDSTQRYFNQLYGTFEGIWIDPDGALYTVGAYMYRFKNDRWEFFKSLPENRPKVNLTTRGYLIAIAGNHANDLIIAGQRGTLQHFNGQKWDQLGPAFNYSNTTHYWYSADIKNNRAVAVGSANNIGRVIVLSR